MHCAASADSAPISSVRLETSACKMKTAFYTSYFTPYRVCRIAYTAQRTHTCPTSFAVFSALHSFTSLREMHCDAEELKMNEANESKEAITWTKKMRKKMKNLNKVLSVLGHSEWWWSLRHNARTPHTLGGLMMKFFSSYYSFQRISFEHHLLCSFCCSFFSSSIFLLLLLCSRARALTHTHVWVLCVAL